MEIEKFIYKLKQTPLEISFSDTIDTITANYIFEPTSFTNGKVVNEAGQNSGSCKLFAFARLHNFSKEETLACFGDYYRVDVLKNITGTDHQNIRNFIHSGWDGISFEKEALVAK